MKNWYQILTDVKNWYSIVTYVNDKTVKNWNRMQTEADFGGVFYQCDEFACMFMKDFVRIFHRV